jgi:hypothetical protein
MATTTPNYGWSVPTSSDLVKNGATAIETLGDSVDDSLWNSGFGQAGKNKIINGDFRINQRSFTSTTTSATYGFDRWRCTLSGGTVTYSAQTFTAGAAPVAGYEAINYARLVTTSQSASSDRAVLNQLIEDVRTLSSSTVTVSFWAQAGSGTPKVNVVLNQNFGTGGSSSVNAPTPTAQTITTAWARYSFTIANPSVSGKTITADSRLNVQIYVSDGGDQATGVGAQNNTFNIWGVQLEYGSKATPFQLAGGGSPQAELAMCQRYYYRLTSDSTGDRLGWGGCNGTTDASVLTQFPVQMRISPTALEQSGTAGDYSVAETGGSVVTCSAVPTFQSSTVASASSILTVTAGLIGTRVAFARATNATAYLGWSAEL